LNPNPSKKIDGDAEEHYLDKDWVTTIYQWKGDIRRQQWPAGSGLLLEGGGNGQPTGGNPPFWRTTMGSAAMTFTARDSAERWRGGDEDGRRAAVGRWRGSGGSKGGNETGGDGDGDREDRHTVVGAVGGASGVVAAAMAGVAWWRRCR